MSLLIRRLLKLLTKIKIVKGVHTVTHRGDIASTNDIYQSRHFGVRLSLERKFSKIFRTLFLVTKPPQVEQFGLVMFFNNSMDVCNLTFMQKVFVDSFKSEVKTTIVRDPKTKKEISRSSEVLYQGFVPNDDQRYFKFLFICPDKSLKKDTVEFNICVL
jgi:hypothetical protein